MSKYFIISILILCPIMVWAQFNFERVPIKFTDPYNNPNYRPEGMCIDPRDSSLVICGRFTAVNDTLSNSIVKYKNGQLIRFPYNPLLVNYRYVHYYKNALYLGEKGLVRLDSSGTVTVLDDDNAAIYCFYTFHDTLYIGGQFDSIGGISRTGGLVGFDGTHFFNVHGFESVNPYIGAVLSICEYDNQLVAGGNWGGYNDSLENIARYDGTKWVSVGGGLISLYFNGVSTMVNHNGELYVGGGFYKPNMSGNCVARWDGSQWHGLGQSFFTTLVTEMIFQKDTLIITGFIGQHVGDSGRAVAMYYDGQWCLNRTSNLFARPRMILEFEGSIYLGGGDLTAVQGDTVGGTYNDKDIIRMTSKKFTPNVIPLTTTSKDKQYDISVFPNPFRDELNITLPNNLPRVSSLVIFDINGKLVYKNTNWKGEHLNMEGIPTGQFVLELRFEDTSYAPFVQVLQRE